MAQCWRQYVWRPAWTPCVAGVTACSTRTTWRVLCRCRRKRRVTLTTTLDDDTICLRWRKWLNNSESVILFGSFSGFLLSLSLVSLVVPFLTDTSESSSLSESLQLQSGDWADSLDKGWEGVYDGRSSSSLLFLNGKIGTLGVSLRIPLLALETRFFSCLG